MNYCCTLPLPSKGEGNITGAPMFMDDTVWNLRLGSNSPCVNAGNNTFISASADLDGRPRIISRTVDLGAYEFQGPFDKWLQQYGFATDGSADLGDPDADGMSNWQEWIAGTSPTNGLSLLSMLVPTRSTSGMLVPWRSVSGLTYVLQRSSDLNAQPVFSILRSNILGQADLTTYLDTNAAGAGPFFYRVGIAE